MQPLLGDVESAISFSRVTSALATRRFDDLMVKDPIAPQSDPPNVLTRPIWMRRRAHWMASLKWLPKFQHRARRSRLSAESCSRIDSPLLQIVVAGLGQAWLCLIVCRYNGVGVLRKSASPTNASRAGC